MTRRLLDLPRDSAGAVLIEFTLVLPILLLLLFGLIQLGLLLNNYIMLTNATSAGARQLSVSRGDSKPWTDTMCQIYATAAGLLGPPPVGLACVPALTSVQTTPATSVKTAMTLTLSVNGTTCTSDSTCLNLLSPPASPQFGALGQPANVTASYPCNIVPGMGNLFGLGSCTLASTMTLSVQ